MFVVRIRRPNEEFDFRAFRSRRSAVVRFGTAQREMIDGDVEDCALFRVEAEDAESAVQRARDGQATLIQANLEDAPRRKARHGGNGPV